MITISGNNIIVTTEEEREALYEVMKNFEIRFEHNGEEVLRVEAPDGPNLTSDKAEEIYKKIEELERKEAEDLINKPNHYHIGGIDIYEIMQMKFTPEEYRGFCKGNILKYTLREAYKGGAEDAKKARFNADRLAENLEGREYIPEYKRNQKEGVKGNS